MALRKLQKEFTAFKNSENQEITAQPANDGDLFNWKATVTGPAGSPYEGGRFFLSIAVPSDYPFKPPKVTFDTKVFHPNVNENGGICLDILKPEHWQPSQSIQTVLMAVQALLAAPTADSPVVPEIGELIKNDRAAFEKKAREWVNQYAK